MAQGQGPTDSQVVDAIRAALKEVDLSQTTERGLRKQLEEQFGVDLTDRKALIRAEVEQFLAQQAFIEGEEEADDDDEEEAADRNRGGGGGSGLSEAMQAFLGEESLPRPQVVKRIWAYIKEHNLQNPANKRKIVVDDKLATLFTPPVDMFSINKQISKHVFSIEGNAAPRKRKGTGDDKQARKKSTGDSSRKPNGFTKQIRVTPELSEWLGGQAQISRPELTRYFWDYVKRNELQDPADKRQILSDDTLRELTGEVRFQAFGFMKLLNKHLLQD